jgi:hypothetical protein
MAYNLIDKAKFGLRVELALDLVAVAKVVVRAVTVVKLAV